MKKATAILTILLCGGLLAGPAVAATIIDHAGNNDPKGESPPWFESIGATGSASASGVTHLTEDAWKITDTDPGFLHYEPDDLTALDFFADPTGWTVEWRVAAEGLREANEDRVAMEIRTGSRRIQLTLTVADLDSGTPNDAILRDRPSGTILKSDIPVLAGTVGDTAFHTYAISFDRSDSSYSVFFDGGLLTRSTTLGTFKADKLLRWGALGGQGSSANEPDLTSYWSSVVFRTGIIVPEPASMTLFAMGLIGLAVYAWRKRR